MNLRGSYIGTEMPATGALYGSHGGHLHFKLIACLGARYIDMGFRGDHDKPQVIVKT